MAMDDLPGICCQNIAAVGAAVLSFSRLCPFLSSQELSRADIILHISLTLSHTHDQQFSICRDPVILGTPTLEPIDCLQRDPHFPQQVTITTGES